jgi:hypothetical protein
MLSEFAIRQRTGQSRRPKLQNISAPAPIAPPPLSGTGAVPIRSKRLNYVAKRAGATGAKATLGKATGKTVPKPVANTAKIPDYQIPLDVRLERADASGQVMGTKRAKAQETYEESFPKRTVDDVISDNIRKKIETKQGVADAETQRLRDKYANNKIPLIAPAVNYVSNKLIDKFGANEAAVVGTLGGLTVAPLAAGTLLYQNYKSKEAEKEKQEQAQGHRDKVAEIIAKRNLLLEQRKGQEQSAQSRVPYNFFSAAPLVAPANFGFPEIGVRNPFFIKKEKALPLAAVGGTLVAGYGLLSKLNKQRALDAYKVNSLKDKNAQDFAANYFDSPQYHADNLIREAANITGNPLLQGITDNPLDRLTPAQQAQAQRKKGATKYARGNQEVANFFDPFIAPSLAIGSAAYGIYNKKRAADEQSEVFEAQKLAALDAIKDKQLRRGLLNKAQNRFIDDESKNRIIDSAFRGDIHGALRTGLKRANWDAIQ